MTLFVLNSGHGINTKGKRSPFKPPGVLEYEFNIAITKRIIELAPQYGGFSVAHLDPEIKSVGLWSIVKRANAFYEIDPTTIFISIHANAMGYGRAWNPTAHGSVVFVSPNRSPNSHRFAKMLAPKIAASAHFHNRGVKKGGYYVLRRTKCPAVLTENGFMTHPSDATKLASDYWRDKIARAHLDAMSEWNERPT